MPDAETYEMDWPTSAFFHFIDCSNGNQAFRSFFVLFFIFRKLPLAPPPPASTSRARLLFFLHPFVNLSKLLLLQIAYYIIIVRSIIHIGICFMALAFPIEIAFVSWFKYHFENFGDVVTFHLNFSFFASHAATLVFTYVLEPSVMSMKNSS